MEPHAVSVMCVCVKASFTALYTHTHIDTQCTSWASSLYGHDLIAGGLSSSIAWVWLESVLGQLWRRRTNGKGSPEEMLLRRVKKKEKEVGEGADVLMCLVMGQGKGDTW